MKKRKTITIIISSIIVICIITAVVSLKIFNKRIIREMPFCYFYGVYRPDMTDEEIEKVFRKRAANYIESGTCENVTMNEEYIVRFEFTQEQIDTIISQEKKLLNDGDFLPLKLNQLESNDYKKLDIYREKNNYEDSDSELGTAISLKTRAMLSLQLFEGISTY